MKPLKLVSYPNRLLLQRSEPVKKFNRDLSILANLMHLKMNQLKGVGLSAVQIGRPIQLITVDTRKADPAGVKRTIVNPAAIIPMDAEPFTYNEGCLSFEGRYAENTRPGKILVSYQDIDGNPKEEIFTGLTAFCIEHELEHLCGMTIAELLLTNNK